jgi:hypothetical protein
MKLQKNKTIVSLTGSNPLSLETMHFCKQTGIIVYIDVDRQIILNRAHKMKLDRIVGSSTMSLQKILDYRGDVYERYYDIRILISDNEDPEVTCMNIIERLNLNEEYISTRGGVRDKYFLDVIREGLAKDGGLYVPQNLPTLRKEQFERLLNLNYNER